MRHEEEPRNGGNKRNISAYCADDHGRHRAFEDTTFLSGLHTGLLRPPPAAVPFSVFAQGGLHTPLAERPLFPLSILKSISKTLRSALVLAPIGPSSSLPISKLLNYYIKPFCVMIL